MDCAKAIAERDQAKHHYKKYVQVLIDSLNKDQIMMNKENTILSSTNPQAVNIYLLLKFS